MTDDALTYIPKGSRALAPLGAPVLWARDLAVVGGLSSFLAPFAVLGFNSGGFSSYSWLAGGVGAVTGAALGYALPRILAGPLGQRKVTTLLAAGIVAGGMWGGLVGAIAAMTTLGSSWLVISTLVAGIAGAIQFGWLWLPYMIRRARQKTTWPVLLGASLLAPALGHLALWIVDFF